MVWIWICKQKITKACADVVNVWEWVWIWGVEPVRGLEGSLRGFRGREW